jgi:hypothetical protein
MNAKVAVVGLLLAASPALADGPLGITMGDKPEDLGCERLDGETVLYVCKTVPRPYDGAAYYSVRSMPGTGICGIFIHGREVKTNAFGVQIRQAVDTVAADLAEAYGAGKKIDQLMSGSSWKDPQYWLIGLRQKERTYQYEWKSDKLKHNVANVVAAAFTERSDQANVVVRFDFTNRAACETENKKAKAKAF